MGLARDYAPLPAWLLDADYGLDFLFFGASESAALDFAEGSSFSLHLAPAGRAKPAADQVHELTSAEDGGLTWSENVVSIASTVADHADWAPGLHEVQLRRTGPGEVTEALYFGQVWIARGLSQLAELGGGDSAGIGGGGSVQIFAQGDAVRVVRGEAAGAAALAAAKASEAVSAAATAVAALGTQNGFILSQVDFWTLAADGGDYGDGTFDVILPGGAVERVASMARLLDVSQKGYAGWSPVLVTAADGPTRVVLQVTDWTGGEGTKPAVGAYLGPAGLVADIAEAVDVFAAVSAHLESLASAASDARDAAETARDSINSADVVKPAATNDQTSLLYFVDAASRILGQVSPDGDWHISLARLATSAGLTLYPYETNDIELGAIVVVDENQRVLWSSGVASMVAPLVAEVATARGARGALGARLGVHLKASGHPRVREWGREFLRQSHMRLARLANGEADQLVLVLGAPGDSYTQNQGRYAGFVAQRLIAKYGNAGGGFFGFGFYGAYAGPWGPGNQPGGRNGNALAYGSTYTGAWVAAYNTSPGPDLSHVTSGAEGDGLIVNVPATPTHTGVRLFWIPTADGVVRYRYGAAEWTSLDVQGEIGSVQWADLAPPPAGAFAFEVQVLDGTVSLCGVDFRSTASGVRVHKLGGSGSRVSQWASHPAVAQQAGFAGLGAHAVVMMDATNSQGAGVQPSTWSTDMTTMIDRWRAALAFPDILLAMPPENLRGKAIPIADYADAALELAFSEAVAFRDLQPDFGLTPADYGSASGFPLFNADNIHPEPATGGRLLAAAILSMLVPFPS